MARESSDRLKKLPSVTSQLFPSLLALESLAVLALAWGLYHRVSRARIGPPLAPLKEFRFNDQLVWGLVAGITAVAVPTLTAFRVVGLNLLMFFGALYALRGLGVLTWFFAPGRLMVALTIGLARTSSIAAPLLEVRLRPSSLRCKSRRAVSQRS